MGAGISITRGCAAALSFDYSVLLLSMSRNLLTKLKETSLHQYIPTDAHNQFHKVRFHGWVIDCTFCFRSMVPMGPLSSCHLEQGLRIKQFSRCLFHYDIFLLMPLNDLCRFARAPPSSSRSCTPWGTSSTFTTWPRSRSTTSSASHRNSASPPTRSRIFTSGSSGR